jgi:hypothetical protein
MEAVRVSSEAVAQELLSVPGVWHKAPGAGLLVEDQVPAKLRSCSTGADSVPAVWHEARIEAWWS